MIEKILGVDLGISSLGWAIVECDTDTDSYRIADCGVRLFTAAETPKEKESPNKARRDARGIRRVLNRRRVRMNEIKRLFIASGLIKHEDLDDEGGMYHTKANRADVWKLRYEALRRKLNGNELARVLVHIAKHRGYKFLGDEGDDESGKVKEAGRILREKYTAANCGTVGEWIWQTYGHKGKKRNKSGDYTFSIHRSLLEDEVEKIFAKQVELGSEYATDELKSKYKDVAFFVKEPPSVEHMVGNCTYFPEEKRAPKCSLTAERFVAVGKFFSTVVKHRDGSEQKIIELRNIDKLLEFAIGREKLEFGHLRKFLNLDEEAVFKGITYKGKKAENALWSQIVKESEKKTWISLKGHTKFKEALGDKFADFVSNIDTADEVAKILTYYKSEKQKCEQLIKLGLDNGTAELLSKISFSDFLMLSSKAIKVILLQMYDGKRYDEAIKILGVPSYEKSVFLPPLKDTDIAILNPTVIRAFAEFRKVANALARKYGAFDKVHFELARDVNTKDQIIEIKKGQSKNEKERTQAGKFIEEYFGGQNIPLNRKNILKVRLYKDQDNRCAYTGEAIRLERLFDEGYCEIDHILPRSRSADDSYANKVLCFSSANQEKSSRTPFEWFGSDEARWTAFEMRINTQANRAKMGKGKVDRLIKQNFDENSENEFLSRNLNDTRYMAKAIKTYCEKYWKLADNGDKLRIQVRSGKLTSELRGRWLEGFMKDRSVHTHHALDAIVIALSTQSMVQKLANFYAAKESRREKQKPEFKAPMPDFRDAVEKALTLEKEENGHKRLLISRPPRASVTGAAHDDTMYSAKYKTVKKNGGKCDRYGNKKENGGYQFIGNGELAKAVQLNNCIAKNGEVVRWDIFRINNKYEFVPIYISNIAADDELPNKTLSGKSINGDEFFCFSMFKNDLIRVQKTDREYILGYYLFMESDGRINMERQEGGERLRFSVLSAKEIKKYQIDPLGYYHEVKNERRLGTIPQEARRNGVHERRAKKQAEKRAAKGK